MIDEQSNSELKSFLNVNERGSDSIVIHIGSQSVKFGLSSQFQPFIVPNVVAYRNYDTNINDDNCDKMDIDVEPSRSSKVQAKDSERLEINDNFLSCLTNIEQSTLKKLIKLEQKLKIKKTPNNPSNKNTNKNYDSNNCESELPERRVFEQPPLSTSTFKKVMAMTNDLNEDVTDNNYKWTAISNQPSYLVGREALTIPEKNKYDIHWPIEYGYFSQKLSYQTVLDDLHKIIDWCIMNVLQIKRKDFSNYGVVLIVPDLMIKTQVKGMINIILRTMGFKSIFVNLESVLSSFGAALQTACVIDIGASKISVCCIDEGTIIEDTLIRKNIGGDDITRLFYLLLSRKNKNYFPIDYFDISDPYHFRIFEKLKEQECELPNLVNPSSQFTTKNIKLWFHQKNCNTKVISANINDALYVPPISLFNPEIFETFKNVNIPYITPFNDIYDELFTDAEDIMAEFQDVILNQNQADKNATANKDNINNINNLNEAKLNNNDQSIKKIDKSQEKSDDDSMSMSNSRSDDNIVFEGNKITMKNTYENQFIPIPLDEIICNSIMSVSNRELRKKLANQILLTGGCARIRGLVDFIEDRLIDKLTELDNEIERIEVINLPNVDSRTLSWIGGSIIPKLESAKDMWIMKERWLGEIEKSDDVTNVNINPNSNNNASNNENTADENKQFTEQQLQQQTKEKTDKTKKKERHLDGGLKVLREKAPFNF